MFLSSIKYLFSLLFLFSFVNSASVLSLPRPNFIISEAKFKLRDDKHYLHVDADFRFTTPVLDALHNGVAMVIVLEVEIYQQRSIIWDKKLSELEQRITLEYFDLSEQYVVNNAHTRERYTAMTLRSVINKFRDIKPMAVIENSELLSSESYYARTRVRLSLNSLPVPLQLNAYISSNWWLYSDWVIRPIVSQQSEAR